MFNFYTYLFATIILCGVYFAIGKKGETQKADFKGLVWLILLVAVCLFANSYFKTLAAGRLDAILLYPLLQGSSLVLSTVLSAVFFKEKITLKAVVGILLAFVGIVTINVL